MFELSESIISIMILKSEDYPVLVELEDWKLMLNMKTEVKCNWGEKHT